MGTKLATRAAQSAVAAAQQFTQQFTEQFTEQEREREPAPVVLTDQATMVVDARGQIRHCSRGAAELLDRSPQLLQGHALTDVLPDLPLRQATPGYNLAYLCFHFGADTWHEASAVGADGDPVQVEVSIAVVQLDRHIWLLVSLRPAQAAMRPRGHMAHLIATLAASSEAAVVTSAEGIIEYANPAYEALTGYGMQELLGQSTRILKSGLHSPDFYQALWEALSAGRTYRAVFANRAKDGRLFYLDEMIRPFLDRYGRITHYVATGRDVSAQVMAQKELQHRADFDGLTGLANRYLLRDRLNQEIARARREGGMFALVCVDLDGFKAINDRLGHLAGDNALRAVSARLTEAVREMDTVGRWGGDEFLLILPGVFEPLDLAAVLSKLLASVASVPNDPRTRTPITLSAGAAIFPSDADDAEELIRKADLAMYQSKVRGGNSYCTWGSGVWGERGGKMVEIGSAHARRGRLSGSHLTCVRGGAHA